jgi:hypothetical protein
MTRSCWLFGLAALGLALGSPARAQEPRVGNDWYKDDVEYGFKVKVPKGWDEIPPQPDDSNLLAKYVAPGNPVISIGKGANLIIILHLLRFDNRPSRDLTRKTRVGSQVIEYTETPATDVHKWLKERFRYGVNYRYDTTKYPKPLKVTGIPEAQVWLYEADHQDDPTVTMNLFVAEFTLADGLKIGLVGNGPGDRRWRNYEGAWSQMAKSFTRVDLNVESLAPEAAMGSPRAKKRADLEHEVAKLGSWRLIETENYFIVTEVDDEDFLMELKDRLEAIRAVYEELYPAEKARAIRKKPSGPEAAKGGNDAPQETKKDNETTSALDPLEASRMSVVRVCRNQQTYALYGGPGGSAGYWSPGREELVLFDDKESGGRRDTWVVLNHEAFHQYIHYFYGTLAPHSWYNEGTGDFFSGYQLKHSRFQLSTNPWRKTTVQGMVRHGPTSREKKGEGYVPLKEFVKWSQSQYYGSNTYDIGGGDCYAQGWALVYFLRTGGQNKAKGWQPAWDKILDVYLETLVTTGDLDEAVDMAFPFSDADWEAFEASWKAYTLSV